MKFLFIGLAIIAAAYAQSAEYLPPAEEAASSVVESNQLDVEPAHSLAEDGYRYRTVKRFRYRHRRDVSNEYLPPNAEAASDIAPVEAVAESVDADASEPAHTLAADGYRYKTVKRYRLRRRRRDVSELANGYLPPNAEAASDVAPVEVAAESIDTDASEPAHTLAADGYRYKTVKRYRLRRRRRDVSELANGYLPPNAEAASDVAPVEVAAESIDTDASEPAHTLAADGYRYKTVKRYRLRRRRRDVSELANGYLPPNAEAASDVAPVEIAAEAIDTDASEPAHTLAADGYRYKTVKRYRLRRRRRDVSELANGYLPPNAEAASDVAPVEVAAEAIDTDASEPAHTLAADGYRYKTVKRYRLRRRRRDVSELANGYLPPNAEAASDVAPVEVAAESIDTDASEPAHTLAADGYRYKTVKRYRLRRRRRDVSELANGYLPPNAEAASDVAPVEVAAESVDADASEPAHTLAADGYRYKTVKRYRLRHRRRY